MATKQKNIQLKPGGRIWINTTDEVFIGKGRIELLEKIEALGSIRQAAIAMKMSYRQAWQEIEEMNTHAHDPIVLINRGGTGGGHAQITGTGKKLINQFHSFSKAFEKFINKQQNKLKI